MFSFCYLEAFRHINYAWTCRDVSALHNSLPIEMFTKLQKKFVLQVSPLVFTSWRHRYLTDFYFKPKKKKNNISIYSSLIYLGLVWGHFCWEEYKSRYLNHKVCVSVCKVKSMITLEYESTGNCRIALINEIFFSDCITVSISLCSSYFLFSLHLIVDKCLGQISISNETLDFSTQNKWSLNELELERMIALLLVVVLVKNP